jgi:hypothetical protein
MRESMQADQLAAFVNGNGGTSSAQSSFAFSFNHFAGVPYQPPKPELSNAIRPQASLRHRFANHTTNTDGENDLKTNLLGNPVGEA